MTVTAIRKADEPLRVSLDAERSRIERGSRLHWLQWTVIGLSTAMTLIVWHVAKGTLEARAERSFDARARQSIKLFTEKLESHAAVLRASAGFLAASKRVTSEQWQHYTDTIALADQFPADGGLGVVYRIPRTNGAAFLDEQRAVRPEFRFFPEHAEDFHLPLVLISPRRIEDRMTGFDLAHEPLRRTAISRAIDRGFVQITEPVELVDQKGLGFIMVAPFAIGERRLDGATIAAMTVGGLASGALDRRHREVAVHISDAGRTLYDEIATAGTETASSPHRSMSRVLPLYGRDWRFEVRSTPDFHDASDSVIPHLTLVCGLVLDVLLLVLFISSSRSNRHCLSFADRTGAALDANRAALQACNDELREFAHVVSHDLKTPLNGVTYLAGFIEEDVEDCEHDADARARVANNVVRLKEQASRGRALIEGVLEYSEAVASEVRTETVDVRTLLEGIGDSLMLRGDQLSLAADLPVLETHSVRLDQVLTNLVSNAVKYHHDVSRLRIEVSAVRPDVRTVRFRVSDNGPGIEKRHRARIFDLFSTLEHGRDTDSTGVGLSIVKKTVEHHGGAVSVKSTPGGGATFVFDWPAYPPALEVMPLAA